MISLLLFTLLMILSVAVMSVSAAFMTAVSLTYILMAKEGFQLNQTISYIAGASAAVILFVIYLIALIRKNKAIRR